MIILRFISKNPNKMKTIGWIQTSSKKYGGIAYNEEAIDALKKEFDVERLYFDAKIFSKIKYLKIPESILRLSKLKGKKDLWIRDFYSTVATPKNRTEGKNFVIIHHDDFSGFPLVLQPIFWILQQIFYRNLKKLDGIITVSEYWKNHFLKMGHKNIFKIYNAFDISEFNITEEEVRNFKKEKNLEKKPIIYLGNCQKAKGVAKAYSKLKGLNAHLVTSGRRQIKIPALNLELDYRGYLTLLKSSLIVLTMSEFKEGWCRTAHEAMLLSVPVIGSGRGGMKELLSGGGQIICEDFGHLRERVEYLLNNQKERERIGKKGYEYAKEFSLEKFNKDWIELIKQILK